MGDRAQFRAQPEQSPNESLAEILEHVSSQFSEVFRRRPDGSLSPMRAERPRGKLSKEALSEHLGRHPIDKRNKDGSHFSDRQRLAALEREQSINITRSALVKRLGPLRRQK